MPAAPRVDDARPTRQLREQRRIEDATSLRRQRQQADQYLGLGEERRQLILTEKAFDLRQRLGRAAPAPHLEAELDQLFRGRDAQLAQPQDPDGAVPWRRIGVRPPGRAALRRL